MTQPATQLQKKPVHYYPHSPIAWEIHNHPARFKVLDCGRRWGKTFLETYECFKSLLQAHIKYEKRGGVMKARGWIVAPVYSLVMEEWRVAIDMFKDVLKPGSEGIKRTEKRLVFYNGMELEYKSADDKDANLRGAGLDVVVMAEAARIPQEAWKEAIRPALADRQGRAIIGSTPKGRNWFYEAYVAGQDPLNTEWKSWHLPSNSRPSFPAEEWMALKKTLPEMIFRQEFEAQFLEDSSAVFRGLQSCVAGDFEEPQMGHQYVMGVDLAKTFDFTVMFVLDLTTKHFVFFDRFQDLDWTLQKQKIYWCARKYNNALVSIDSTGVGDPIEEDLRRAGLRVQGFKFNLISKKELVENGIIALEQRWVTYPEIPEFLNEMMAFEYELLPSGKVRYNAPAGAHDDTVIAFLLALWPLRSVFHPQNLQPDFSPPKDLSDREYEFWERHQKSKKQINDRGKDPGEGIYGEVF